MIDFTNIEKYKENNRIEAKKALGGLPHSIWETYSAFANTLGGIILLGVEEQKDKSLHPIDLPDPELLIEDFWEIVNDLRKVSVNILSEKDVTVEQINGKRIVAIRVPRARRSDKPVFVEGDPFSGSYRRNGEGDYRCTKEEVHAMLRDAAIQAQDMAVLEDMDLTVFDYDSVKRYRTRMETDRPGHAWEGLEDVEFLYKLGAVGRSGNGKMCPTAAGLLMFGYEYEIVKEYPAYFLDYREQMESDTRWCERIVSSSGDWSGNIYDFYVRVCNKITQEISIPLNPDGGDPAPIHNALREALANCLINADYYGRQGIVVIKSADRITLSNPGGFRIDVETAKSGGVSDPRNSGLIRMFNLIDVGERTGSGIPHIINVWNKQGWPAPVITESFEPDRITLALILGKNKNPKAEMNEDVHGQGKTTSSKSQIQKQAVIAYLTERVEARTVEVAGLLGVQDARARRLLAEMVAEGTVVTDGGKRNRVYKLRA
jgi:predicted HTH transcriptional regulator